MVSLISEAISLRQASYFAKNMKILKSFEICENATYFVIASSFINTISVFLLTFTGEKLKTHDKVMYVKSLNRDCSMIKTI